MSHCPITGLTIDEGYVKFYSVEALNGDGQPVLVERRRMPASFFKLIVFPVTTSTGRELEGFVLNTGTIGEKFAIQLADAIAAGMIQLGSVEDI